MLDFINWWFFKTMAEGSFAGAMTFYVLVLLATLAVTFGLIAWRSTKRIR